MRGSAPSPTRLEATRRERLRTRPSNGTTRKTAFPCSLLGLGVLSPLVSLAVWCRWSRRGDPVVDVFTFEILMLLVGAVTAGVARFTTDVLLALAAITRRPGTSVVEWAVATGAPSVRCRPQRSAASPRGSSLEGCAGGMP